MKCYEYFQETVASIADDHWSKLLRKHGSQGWILCTINRDEAYKKRSSADVDEGIDEALGKPLTIYTVIFRRQL